MKKLLRLLKGIAITLLVNPLLHATVCPDPNTSSLQWGKIPPPWVVNPFSPNVPQGEANTQFVRANIFLSMGLAAGVGCTYRNSLGEYSIGWPVLVKIPAPQDYYWIDTMGGFVCTASLEACKFSAAG